MGNNSVICWVLLCFLLDVPGLRADKPCAGLNVEGQSIVCVCNETYCDDLSRQPPGGDEYVAYTSSEAGSRFRKFTGNFGVFNSTDAESDELPILKVLHEKAFQTIKGFGGAVTDAAGINWKNLSQVLQQSLIDSYFSDSGLRYSFIRVPIGGSDFSTHAYAYNELPENDKLLTNFTLTTEDFNFKIPMIKAAMASSSTNIKLVATTWSPPVWMKTNNAYYGFSRLKPEFYQTYADYYYKFIDAYAGQGVPIWAITTTNEPLNGVVPLARFNSLGWSAKHMGEWLINNLGPTIRGSRYNSTKILTVDDQRFTIPLWFNVMIKEHPKALDVIDGIGVHYYGDAITPAAVLDHVTKKHPDKFILLTEASEGSFPWQIPKVLLGSWQRASSYVQDIIINLSHNIVGWIEWNLCLNDHGGPNWANNFVDSPIIVFPENKQFVKQPMYYAIGHFSKFIPEGSKRILSEGDDNLSCCNEHVAVLTPMNTIVAVIWNKHTARQIAIQLGRKRALVELEAKSVTTVEFPAP